MLAILFALSCAILRDELTFFVLFSLLPPCRVLDASLLLVYMSISTLLPLMYLLLRLCLLYQ